MGVSVVIAGESEKGYNARLEEQPTRPSSTPRVEQFEAGGKAVRVTSCFEHQHLDVILDSTRNSPLLQHYDLPPLGTSQASFSNE